MLLDWQFAAIGNPFLDLGTLALLSMSPDLTESNLDDLLDAYFDQFASTASDLGVKESPWGSRSEFAGIAKREGFLLCFCWIFTSYMLAEKFPAMRSRMVWACVKTLEYNPDLFK